jgi:hypothetical protein
MKEIVGKEKKLWENRKDCGEGNGWGKKERNGGGREGMIQDRMMGKRECYAKIEGMMREGNGKGLWNFPFIGILMEEH